MAFVKEWSSPEGLLDKVKRDLKEIKTLNLGENLPDNRNLGKILMKENPCLGPQAIIQLR